jgi:asparagine synthase (glutamine-hydrolysing)
MISFDGKLVIVFNGEIYNFKSIKNELRKKGYEFRSESDTEVLLNAWHCWKEETLQKIDGMFAFAIWDTLNLELYLVRDSAGIKPLYYSITNDGLVFASEVKAFKNNKLLQNQHPNWKVYMMAYGHLPEPITTIQGVHPLEKGTWLKYQSTSREYFIRKYFQASYTEIINDRKDASELIKISLAKSPKKSKKVKQL